MIQVDLPNRQPVVLTSLFMDLNGTLALDGELLPGVTERVRELTRDLSVYLITAGTFGKTEEIASEIGATLIPTAPGREAETKYVAILERAEPRQSVAIGNGANDAFILRHCVLGIVVLGPEGAHAQALINADVVCTSPQDALDLLLNPRRLTATLRS